MLPRAADGRDPTRLFGTYNTVATLAGSLGALAAGGPRCSTSVAASPARLSGRVAGAGCSSRRVSPRRSNAATARARDAPALGELARRSSAGWRAVRARLFGGGFVTQAFIAYWFSREVRHVAGNARRRVLRGRDPAGGLVPGRRSARRPDRAAAHDGLHPPPVERAARADPVRAEARRRRSRCCSPASRSRRWTCPTRQAYVVGGRRPERAHRRRRLHEHGPLRVAAVGAARCRPDHAGPLGAPFVIALTVSNSSTTSPVPVLFRDADRRDPAS